MPVKRTRPVTVLVKMTNMEPISDQTTSKKRDQKEIYNPNLSNSKVKKRNRV